jgi:hypothetical protein
LRFLRATSTSGGTPSFGNWLRAKTACFFNYVSGLRRANHSTAVLWSGYFHLPLRTPGTAPPLGPVDCHPTCRHRGSNPGSHTRADRCEYQDENGLSASVGRESMMGHTATGTSPGHRSTRFARS